ncbi:MAG: hypothetical protein HYR91_08715 [Flavobacteriia bacterium]|nr:hypothetical protein [Flavobacteriia bacterium]
MKRFFKSKWFKIPFFTGYTIFALAGVFYVGTFLAIKFKWTNESGAVDTNTRYFQEIRNKYNQSFKKNITKEQVMHHEALHRILILNKYYPKNANFILNAYLKSKNENEVLRMLGAVDMYMKENKSYMAEIKAYQKNKHQKHLHKKNGSVFDWMNINEWMVFKTAVAKDRKIIDSVSNLTGVESRLIVSCLVGEQIRLFNSSREAFKKWIGPLKILSVESQFSFGVTGIKELTAIQIEEHLKDSTSKYYLGKEYEHLLDFKTNNPTSERINRLTDFKKHFYSYMYAAIFLKQMKVQWEKAGYPIEDRPEILATLFNVGYPQSIPKKNPQVGGSTIKIDEKPHSFGSIAYEFYYSGELFEIFPFKPKKFDWNVAS